MTAMNAYPRGIPAEKMSVYSTAAAKYPLRSERENGGGW